MPFEDKIDYARFALNFEPTPTGVAHVASVLKAIASNRTHLRAMQRAMWEARPWLDWTDLSPRGTFHRILEQLAARKA